MSFVEKSLGNRHAADRLFDIRQSIRELEHQEAALRIYLIQNAHDRHGDQYCALIRPYERRHVDMQALASEIGEEIMAKHTVRRAVDTVRLRAIQRSTRRKAASALLLDRA